jgi:hypothetical protein
VLPPSFRFLLSPTLQARTKLAEPILQDSEEALLEQKNSWQRKLHEASASRVAQETLVTQLRSRIAELMVHGPSFIYFKFINLFICLMIFLFIRF